MWYDDGVSSSILNAYYGMCDDVDCIIRILR